MTARHPEAPEGNRPMHDRSPSSPRVHRRLLAALLLCGGLAASALAQKPAGPQSGPPSGPPPPAPRLELNFPPPPDPLTQDYVARKFIYSLLAGQIDTLKPLFEEEVRPYITEQLVERMRSQVSWLYGMIGGDFVQLFTGGTDSMFFREYRLANETNDRSPLVVVHVVFRDSTTPTLMAAQVKNFLGGNEKRIAGAQTWKIGNQKFDIHSLVVVPVDSGSVMAIQFYDDSQDTLSQEMVNRIGIPIIREALARGYLDSARAVVENPPLVDRIGVAFIRKDKRQGLMYARIGFAPEDYKLPADSAGGKTKAGQTGKAATKKKAAPAVKKTEPQK